MQINTKTGTVKVGDIGVMKNGGRVPCTYAGEETDEWGNLFWAFKNGICTTKTASDFSIISVEDPADNTMTKYVVVWRGESGSIWFDPYSDLEEAKEHTQKDLLFILCINFNLETGEGTVTKVEG